MLGRRISGVGIISDYEPIPIEENSKSNRNDKSKGDSLFLYFASFAGKFL